MNDNLELKQVNYFDNLDAIRFIAAMMVFFSHAFLPTFNIVIEDDLNIFLRAIFNLIYHGRLGVTIFFVLSGFLITYLLIQEYEKNGKINLKKFYIRRFLRIWPLYYLVLGINFILYPIFISGESVFNNGEYRFLWHALFLSNFDVIQVFKYHSEDVLNLVNITWSVSIEEQFYLFWPLIFKFSRSKIWTNIIIGIILFSITFRFIYYVDYYTLYFNTFSVIVDLSFGGLFALLSIRLVKFKAYFSNVTFAKSFFHGFLLISVYIFSILNEDWEYAGALNKILFVICFAMIITSQALNKRDSIFNFKNLKVFSRLGKYTYGIYLLHPFAMMISDKIFVTINFSEATLTLMVVKGVLSLFLILVISFASYHFYEKRFIKMKDKFSVLKIKAK